MRRTLAFFDLTAADLMSRAVVTLPQDTALPDAVRLLARARVGGAPVVDPQGRCVGVFSTSDLARRAEAEKQAARMAPPVPGCVCSDWEVVEHDWDTLPADAVSRYMTAYPALVPPTAPVGELAQRMVDAGIHRLIVADEDGRPIGVVAGADLLAAVAHAASAQV